METYTVEQLLEMTRATIHGAEFCFLITRGNQEEMNARMMQPFEPEEDFTIWMGASTESRKVEEILENERVTLAYPYVQENAYATLLGRAEIVNEAASKRKYWIQGWQEFYPQGPEEGYLLIRFTPERIELMNFARDITPEPFGLQPAVLRREEGAWKIGG